MSVRHAGRREVTEKSIATAQSKRHLRDSLPAPGGRILGQPAVKIRSVGRKDRGHQHDPLRTLVVSGRLDAEHGREGTVRLEAGLSRVEPDAMDISSPVVTTEGSDAHQRVLNDFEEFRQLFPPHACYARIVPVDEVVTLTLFYRQDDALRRLLLDDGQTDKLDRM